MSILLRTHTMPAIFGLAVLLLAGCASEKTPATAAADALQDNIRVLREELDRASSTSVK